MKHVKSFSEFNTINEDFLSSMMNAAKGAFKNLLNALGAPFKSLNDKFKKELDKEQAKSEMIKTLDEINKKYVTEINKAEDEIVINQMRDAFKKEIDAKMLEFDKEINSVKENLILEGVRDTMIRGRVLLNMVKNSIALKKQEYDKKLAEAKDLAAKRTVAVAEMKAIIDDFKTKIKNDQLLKSEADKYMKEKNIKITNKYKVGDIVTYKRDGYDSNKKPEEQEDKVGEKEIVKIDGDSITFNGEDGKEFKKNISDIIGKSDKNEKEVEKDINKEIEDLTDPEDKDKVLKFTEFLKDKANKDKVEQMMKTIGGE